MNTVERLKRIQAGDLAELNRLRDENKRLRRELAWHRGGSKGWRDVAIKKEDSDADYCLRWSGLQRPRPR